jgi:sporadic carbohydrate cluster 2OG-Fe(II) oxygenase
MTIFQSFEDFESEDSKNFLENGYFTKKCENLEGLDNLKSETIKLFHESTDGKYDNKNFSLDEIHLSLNKKEINDIRMIMYSRLNSYDWIRPTYFSFARTVIEDIIGRELVIQNRINLNIMMPNDEGSNIHPHVDPHSGESPYQCVVWLPLTDCYDSKSICILPPKDNNEALTHFKQWMENGGRERVFREVEDKLVWVDIPYGYCLIFTPTLIHGSTVNKTNETRWSFNTRFKALFTPYYSQEKGLGSFYLPIRTAPATHFGLKYTPPAGMEQK